MLGRVIVESLTDQEGIKRRAWWKQEKQFPPIFSKKTEIFSIFPAISGQLRPNPVNAFRRCFTFDKSSHLMIWRFDDLKPGAMKNDEFRIQPYTLKQLAQQYRTSLNTFGRWVAMIPELGPRVGHFYNPKQVRIIVEHLGAPW